MRLPRLAPLAAASLLLLGALVPTAPAATLPLPDRVPNVGFAWGEEEIPLVVPYLGYHLTPDERLGCLGTVHLIFANGMQTLAAGLAAGEASCSPEAPCLPYAALPSSVLASCSVHPFLCCTTVVIRDPQTIFGGDLADLGCLSSLYVTRDDNGDRVPEERYGPFYGVPGPCDDEA